MKLYIVPIYAVSLANLFGCASPSASGAPPTSPAPPVAVASLNEAALDGKSYEVMLEMPDVPAIKDTLRFANGKFESTACTSLGFPQWSDYAARADKDEIAFHVLAKHPAGTSMDWNGDIKGDIVQGTANRTMNGKTDVLRFKGSLQP